MENDVLERDGMETELKQDKKKKWRGYLFEALIYISLCIICAVVIPNYVAQRAKVSGPSMENTLFDGDNVLVDKISYRFHNPKRFDVVVFYPYEGDDEHFVKRVIGLPGETIQIIGPDIYINGELLEEKYGKDPIHYQGIAANPLTLGDDEFFLMGDNREVSFDSRYEDIGAVHKRAIDGKAILRMWPIKDFGTFK
ncbi:MAG: signal peptidase I [Clostridium sp.]|nr:signal peptidase I [Clostridium sp.]